eukprot:CAMPEP_0201542370 /NCGR_PEP_ID=MMETSP0161_2-20130828/71999_1 /ASSEMBLY_ACC=CAM_ASM_000251 /TAXON_ID=180227 /ORGANISM="Neoparamoeba aestuarina, Strain SoJaBio B1-5/56/2" /LENGTH=70 /DNA_ID=CAMNT_0047950015 /DNA_START=160 /DNA_END=372 /DNA_ORIENTATION=+
MEDGRDKRKNGNEKDREDNREKRIGVLCMSDGEKKGKRKRKRREEMARWEQVGGMDDGWVDTKKRRRESE